MEQYKNRIYSIGYAIHTIESFINTLKKFNITAIADVRSQPYSKFKPEFNRENLKQALINNGIEYVFLGDNIGARIEAPECYKNGKADYHLISKRPLFQKGVGRILKGMKKYSIAIMCAEKDPINCHRTILICKHLKNDNIKIIHIIDSNTTENHTETELRLMKLYQFDQPDLFINDSERLEEAYNRQWGKIAYVAETAADYTGDNEGSSNE